MAFSFKPLLRKLGIAPFKWRWVLIAGCAAAAWMSLRHEPVGGPGGTTLPSAAAVHGIGDSDRALPVGEQHGPASANGSGSAGTPAAANTDTARFGPTRAGATVKTVSSASFGLSTINVIVHPNDTLDAIFRRLKLNLTDLASLRGLPGLKSRLDSLRPGESLRLWHRDGSLFGLERRLNEEQTLKVVRDPSGLKADVLHNPLDSRQRTLHAVINNSLFEAVEAAGGHDQTAVALA